MISRTASPRSTRPGTRARAALVAGIVGIGLVVLGVGPSGPRTTAPDPVSVPAQAGEIEELQRAVDRAGERLSRQAELRDLHPQSTARTDAPVYDDSAAALPAAGALLFPDLQWLLLSVAAVSIIVLLTLRIVGRRRMRSTR